VIKNKDYEVVYQNIMTSFDYMKKYY